MDIRQLEYFLEIAKQLNFTKAASVLLVSQPSLSKTIKSMEDELGVPLFYRSAKQLELTDAGKALLVNAKTVIEAFNNLTSELNDVVNLKKGEVRIGIPPIIGAAFFSTIISQFIETYPQIEVTLTEVGSKKIKDGVEEGILDIGLICNLPIQKGSFETIKLLRDPLMLIAHEEHRLADKSTVSFTDIDSEPLIQYRHDFSLHDSIMEECARNDIYPHIVCESSQRDFMIEMVEAKLGIALLPSQICETITNNKIVTIPFEQPTINLELGMIWKKNKYLPFAVREFIDITKKYPL